MEQSAKPDEQPTIGGIACIGWGSLIWDHGRPFPVMTGWHEDGPSLPLEFARESGKPGENRITLVIVDDPHRVPTLWAELDARSLGEAVTLLTKREGVPHENAIGRWPNNTEETYPHEDEIGAWATAKGLAGVVWTALPPGMKKSRGVMLTLEDVKTYLASLSEREREGALVYIRNAPEQIATRYRRHLNLS